MTSISGGFQPLFGMQPHSSKKKSEAEADVLTFHSFADEDEIDVYSFSSDAELGEPEFDNYESKRPSTSYGKPNQPPSTLLKKQKSSFQQDIGNQKPRLKRSVTFFPATQFVYDPEQLANKSPLPSRTPSKSSLKASSAVTKEESLRLKIRKMIADKAPLTLMQMMQLAKQWQVKIKDVVAIEESIKRQN